MNRLSGFSKLVLALTAAFLLLCTGYYLGDRATGKPYRVTTGRDDRPVSSSVSSVPEETYPESLLEGEVININTASALDLTRLPGIGESRANAIVAWREENGPFQTPEDLMLVSGIGEGIFAGLRDYITL